MDIIERYAAAYHDEEFHLRFYKYIELGCRPEIDCWRWMGYITRYGYGQIAYGYKRLSAHRFMYTLVTGRYPFNLEIHHICGNRWCVSPYHLEALTYREHRSTRRDVR